MGQLTTPKAPKGGLDQISEVSTGMLTSRNMGNSSTGGAVRKGAPPGGW